MPTPSGKPNRRERLQTRLAEATSQAARETISAALMSGRTDRALQRVNVEDVVAGDLATRYRVIELEMFSSMYRAKNGEGNPVAEQRAISAAKVVIQTLDRQAELAGLKSAAQAAPGAEAGPGGEQIQALLRHVLRTDPLFEKAYMAAAAGKPWQEALAAAPIEAKKE